MALAQYSSELDCLIEVTQQQVRQDLLNKKVTVRHREDKSGALLDLSCLKTFCRVAECRKVRFTWHGQRSFFFITCFETLLLSCSGGVAGWCCLIGFMGEWGPVRDNRKSSSNFRPTAV